MVCENSTAYWYVLFLYNHTVNAEIFKFHSLCSIALGAILRIEVELCYVITFNNIIVKIKKKNKMSHGHVYKEKSKLIAAQLHKI